MIEIIFYHKDSGECPLEEYLGSLTPKLRTKTLRSIMLLEEFGDELRLPYSRSLGKGLYELRSVVGTDITRVIYFFLVGNRAVLTHGFTKKLQKTPSLEIERAVRYREHYYKREEYEDE